MWWCTLVEQPSKLRTSEYYRNGRNDRRILATRFVTGHSRSSLPFLLDDTRFPAATIRETSRVSPTNATTCTFDTFHAFSLSLSLSLTLSLSLSLFLTRRDTQRTLRLCCTKLREERHGYGKGEKEKRKKTTGVCIYKSKR